MPKVNHPSKQKIILLILVIVSSLLIQAQNGTGTTIYFPIVAKNTAPPYSTSYYIQDGDPALMYDLGCQLGLRDAQTPGKQDSVVILDFAQMWIENGEYGALVFAYPFASNVWLFRNYSELKDSARGFATGYWICSGNDNLSHLTLGVGTSNYGFFNQPVQSRSQENLKKIAEDFGRNWAYMINDLNAWAVQQNYSGQILFTGAIDIEWDSVRNNEGLLRWQSAYVVKGWVDAFDSSDMGQSIFFNYGACVGCYDYVDPNWKFISTNYWTIFDVWYVSWGAKPAFVIPEIYRTDGFLAKQWAIISEYGARYQGSRIVFSGVMTQWQACQQRGGSDPSCATLDNTPAEGWSQLVDAINADVYTISPAPVWSTDIKWQYK